MNFSLGMAPQLVATFSYGMGALAFMALLLFIMWSRLHRGQGRWFAIAAILSTAWAGTTAMAGALATSQRWLIDGAEVLRSGAWLLLLVMIASKADDGGRRRRWLLMLLAALALQLGASTFFFLWHAHISLMLTAMRVLAAVAGMLLVEQVYRAAPLRARWGIKLACLGMGAMFAYDFYLYADALLFQRIHGDIWSARGIVNALCAPLLAAALTRTPNWTSELHLSRQLMFRSVALLGAACYLLAMASSAWYLRAIGGAWGPVMELACLAGAVLLLAALIFSGTVQARLRVLIGKHFYRGRYDYRAEWRRLTDLLADQREAPGERCIQALAGLVESPAGMLWTRCGEAWFQPAASWNMTPLQQCEAADGELCRFLAVRAWVIELDDWRRDARPYGGLRLPSWLDAHPSLWLLTPLMIEQQLFGFVCLAQPRTPVPVNWEVRDMLRIAGRQVASFLAQRAAADNLAMARQFEAVNRMATFVVHDLKNLVAQLSLLLSNAQRHKANPAFQDDMLATLAHSLDKMQHLLHKLRQEPVGAEDGHQTAVALSPLLAQVVNACAAMRPRPVLAQLPPSAAVWHVLADRRRLERVLGHLILNAVEATPADGSVSVRLVPHGAAAHIEIRDSGCGMSAAFIRDQLFQPFATTKAAGMGIGVFESRDYLQQIGARLDVRSQPGSGTVFTITLPLLPIASTQGENDGKS
ncbi:MAG: XrtA/PEP-CTERM system histidine kinase PrsK [Duganella sp.]